ncbi:hypothetical protein [Bradyrhizobium sp. CCBAU 11357]|uniref:hypothetical protein n=1 Tax=Bradyrhizobium sp. CCBAU 11357 TaxID=1630808 RepID=UPI00230259E6|nr:hypothetical protein [Bradyrhizobium sp. CCBAU 11357]
MIKRVRLEDTDEVEEEERAAAAEVLTVDFPEDVTLHQTGLSLPDELDYEVWSAIGQKLVTTKEGLQWALGDWWAYGEDAYKIRKDELKVLGKKLGYKSGSLMNLGTISRKVPPSSRNEALSWSHHKVVSKLDRDAQRKWLEQAANGKWSVRQMQKQIRERRGFEEKPEERSFKIWANDIRKKAKHALQLGTCDAASYSRLMDDGTVKELRTLAREVESAWKAIAEELEQFQQKASSKLRSRGERHEHVNV